MLSTILPEETALVRGYLTSRGFPAKFSVTHSLEQQKSIRKPCMSRLPKILSTWRTLLGLLDDQPTEDKTCHQLSREQVISGLSVLASGWHFCY